MTDVIVLVGAGSIGQAIARRVSAGKHVLLADLRQENADAAAKTLSEAGFDVSAATVDVSSRAGVEALSAHGRLRVSFAFARDLGVQNVRWRWTDGSCARHPVKTAR